MPYCMFHSTTCLKYMKAVILGEEVEMREEKSGHFSLLVDTPKHSPEESSEEELCLAVRDEELTEEQVWKLHQYWGHKPAAYLKRLISDAGKLTPNVRESLKKIEGCKSCRLTDRRKPRPNISFPMR